MSLKIYISTCDKHIHLVKGHQYLFKKFWKNHPKVIVLGYKEPDFELESNYEFVSMGEDRGVEYWATDLRNYFKSIDDTHFIYGMDDHWIPREVDERVFNILSEYVKDEKVGRINLTDDTKDRPHSHLDVNDGLMVIESDQWMPGESYRISTQYSIWNKEWMLKYLKDGMSPWEFELNGSLEANNDGYRVLGSLYEYAMKNMQVVVRGNLETLHFHWVNEREKMLDWKIIQDMKEKNII